MPSLLTLSMDVSARSRKLVQEDLSTGPKNSLSAQSMPSVEVTPVTAGATVTSTPMASRGNYIAADPGTPQNFGTLTYPAAPAPDATLPMLTQAISQFLNFSGQVDAQKNPQKFPDWVNPTQVTREARAPGYGNITSQALDPQCPNLPTAAVEKMRKYLAHCQNSLQIPNGLVSIVDFSTNAPVMYLLKKDDLSCAGSTRVTFGTGSHQTQPRAGNVSGSHMTPSGFHITKTHNGALYKDWNSIGLFGVGSENSNTVARGVIIHPVRGSVTLGCVGIPETRFAAVKQNLGVGSVVFNYFPNNTHNDSQNRCPVYKTRSDGPQSRHRVRPGSAFQGQAPDTAADADAHDGIQ